MHHLREYLGINYYFALKITYNQRLTKAGFMLIHHTIGQYLFIRVKIT